MKVTFGALVALVVLAAVLALGLYLTQQVAEVLSPLL